MLRIASIAIVAVAGIVTAFAAMAAASRERNDVRVGPAAASERAASRLIVGLASETVAQRSAVKQAPTTAQALKTVAEHSGVPARGYRAIGARMGTIDLARPILVRASPLAAMGTPEPVPALPASPFSSVAGALIDA